MNAPVKERLKSELEQAKAENKQRAARIGDILKAAASMTAAEIKDGSAELHTLTRKSLAEVLADLQEADAATTPTETGAEPQPDAPAAQPAPSWQELLRHAAAIVRDRRGDWLQQLKDYWQGNAAKFDQDMTADYGDRYRKAKSIFQRAVAWFEARRADANAVKTESDVQPVAIEVMDGNSTENKRADGVNASMIDI